ncbi:MAG: DUF1501 domain-containing protein [Candidatus Sericytochromatia bacterium]|nr:DUF1501 domain-containing protein [Candidatus Sericytochromatia bacterium]
MPDLRIDRRQFLQGLGLAAGACLWPVGRAGWAWAGSQPASQRLVVVFLRGAVDGLSVVVPYRDPHYAEARPQIALGAPGETDGVLPLTAEFGLHPALAPLLPFWEGRRLAFVHACGDPAGARSHFEAQAAMEAGTLGRGAAAGGWLARWLALFEAGAPAGAIALDTGIPAILRGSPGVQVVTPGRGRQAPMALDRPAVQTAFDRLYSGDDPLALAYRQGRAQRERLLADLTALEAEANQADAGAPSAVGLVQDAEVLARLLRRHPEIRGAFLPVGGWDTHINQGGAQGQLANRLRPLASGLAALAAGLGDELTRTTVLVMSEFGRTVAENGNGGTDHGAGNVLWLLGGPVAGGQVLGRWPGLAPAARLDGRDLAVTTDWRRVVATLLGGPTGLETATLARLFPGLAPAGLQLPGLLRAT